MKQFLQRVKFVKISDICAIPLMFLSFLLSPFFKLRHRDVWLVCERECEARDNGYWFYKYLCEQHSEIESVYVINKRSNDFRKVDCLGKVISFGSFEHWLYYWSAKWNISSQKEGKPNAALCFILEVYLGLRKNRIYLKHGIIKDAQRWVYNDVSKFSMLCCAAKREQTFIQDNFGYPPNAIKLTGLCRFDNLCSEHITKRQIVVMPTMREWLRVISTDTLKYEHTLDFCKSEYYVAWTRFLSSPILVSLLDQYGVDLLFYPHPAMQKYLKNFENRSSKIVIASSKSFDLQRLLMESSVLITDYSSIFFDFAYMNKPLLYYQFDREKYREGQYQEGYFSYEKDGFGPVCLSQDSLLEKLKSILEDNMNNPKCFTERSKSFFAFQDSQNCHRVYEAINKLRR